MTVEVPAINEDKLNAFMGQVVGELGATVNAAPAAAFPGANYDLVTMFDCLHDMGDPVGAAGHVRQALAPDGTWMVVEPIAGECRLSTHLCFGNYKARAAAPRHRPPVRARSRVPRPSRCAAMSSR